MNRLLVTLAILTSAIVGNKASAQALKEGDIVFQTLPCGGLCDAIIATTPCENDRRFNHCGVIRLKNNELYVVEAIGEKVQETPLSRFTARDTARQLAIGRPRYTSASEARAAAAKAASYIGRPYDDPFLPGDSALYCSELIWESCRNNGKRIFTTAPMTFKEGGETHKAWQEYYQSIGASIPEGVPGINPCAIANSPKLIFFRVPKQSLHL